MGRSVRVRILSRSSDLARLQAMLVGRALAAADPEVEIEYVARTATGDRDQLSPLASFADKGAFTADLSDALAAHDADLVVHSWKDLPTAPRPDTALAGTIERADPRDVLLVRRESVDQRPRILSVLSSSPRRAWLTRETLPSLLPWAVDEVDVRPVRGNVPTRLRRLVDGDADALVVAKAALDRLLEFGEPFQNAADAIRRALAACRWMVLPIRECPTAPAQGAIGIETRASDAAIRARVEAITHAPTWCAVNRERKILMEHGGGCHTALGATVLTRDYGDVLSVRAQTMPDGSVWQLVADRPRVPETTIDRVWPAPADRGAATRRPLTASRPGDVDAFWIARAEALPADWHLSGDQIAWTAGSTTWRRLAARGVWVHGCADGLGDAEPPHVDVLAGRRLSWCRLTHRAVVSPDAKPDLSPDATHEPGERALATYDVDRPLPADLPSRTHFFWTSGTELRMALSRWPELRDRWHASGPGRTWRTLQHEVGRTAKTGIFLDYDDWLQAVCRR
jgi:hydroxymethylbilane synthase